MLLDHFADLADPRSGNATRHRLTDILAIALCATLAGADGFADMERFGRSKQAWCRRWLDLPGGVPSHDTFNRVFAALDAEHFAACFAAWTRSVAAVSEGEVVALDGKVLRHSASGDGRALEMVSAWATQNRLVLAHVPVTEGSNEITALPAVLARSAGRAALLDVRGCLVTIDAAGCQTEIAAAICGQGADYMLALKANQPSLHADVSSLFAPWRGSRASGTSVRRSPSSAGTTCRASPWTPSVSSQRCGATGGSRTASIGCSTWRSRKTGTVSATAARRPTWRQCVAWR